MYKSIQENFTKTLLCLSVQYKRVVFQALAVFLIEISDIVHYIFFFNSFLSYNKQLNLSDS